MKLNKNRDFLLIIMFNLIVSILILKDSIILASILCITNILAIIIETRSIRSKKYQEFNIILNDLESLSHYLPIKFSIIDNNNKTIISNINKKNITHIINLDNKNTYNEKTLISQNLLDKAIINTKDDSYLYYKYPIYTNKLIGYFQIEVNITEIINYQQKLINLNNTLMKNNEIDNNIIYEQLIFKNILDNSSDSIIACQYDKKINEMQKLLFCTNSTQKIIEFNIEELRENKKNLYQIFNVAEIERVKTILSTINEKESILFETLINNNQTIPVEINVTLCKINTIDIICFNIRNIQIRKTLEISRDKNRAIAVYKNSSTLMNYILNAMYIKIGKSTNIINNKINEIKILFSDVDSQSKEIIANTKEINTMINNLVAIYSPTYTKSYINIKSTVEIMQKTIFFKEIMNRTAVTIIQQGEVEDVYCEDDALRYVIRTLVFNAKERIEANYGTNFYGDIAIIIQNMDKNYISINIEDNSGKAEKETLDKFNNIIYYARDSYYNIRLSMCAIVIEETLKGNFNINGTDKGIKIKIQIPKK